jgi:hypothetical protein
MSKEIEAVIDASEIESKNVEVGEWGLNFKGQLTTEEWLDVALSIQKFDGKIQWYLGDLAVYAESPTTGWGESKYTQLIEGTGYEYGTLRNFASVARRFNQDFRAAILSPRGYTSLEGLSFNHFRLVMSLDDNFATYWLQKAADNAWGVAKLREEIRKWKEGRGEIAEKEEIPVGYSSFKEQMGRFFKGYLPNLSQEEYDYESWLLEVHDVIGKELERLGIING